MKIIIKIMKIIINLWRSSSSLWRSSSTLLRSSSTLWRSSSPLWRSLSTLWAPVKKDTLYFWHPVDSMSYLQERLYMSDSRGHPFSPTRNLSKYCDILLYGWNEYIYFQVFLSFLYSCIQHSLTILSAVAKKLMKRFIFKDLTSFNASHIQPKIINWNLYCITCILKSKENGQSKN